MVERETNMRQALRDAANCAEWGPLRRRIKAALRRKAGIVKPRRRRK